MPGQHKLFTAVKNSTVTVLYLLSCKLAVIICKPGLLELPVGIKVSKSDKRPSLLKVLYYRLISGLYYKNILMIISDNRK
jgi:hypothetical protein